MDASVIIQTVLEQNRQSTIELQEQEIKRSKRKLAEVECDHEETSESLDELVEHVARTKRAAREGVFLS